MTQNNIPHIMHSLEEALIGTPYLLRRHVELAKAAIRTVSKEKMEYSKHI